MILNYFHRHCNKTYYTTFPKHAAFVLIIRCLHKKRDKEQAVTNTHINHAKDGLEIGMGHGLFRGRINFWFEAHLVERLIYIIKKR
jgi:hypothetical protein